jgi:iron complex transport system substrate-binding protein
MRMVSMLPSATEIVYALGLDEHLVGVTFECDEPREARLSKAVVVGGRDTSGMTPAEIDSYVRDRLAAGEDLYTLDAGALARLDPDLILTQDLCRVCAIPSGDVDAALDHLGCRADVVSLDPHSLDEVLASIETVARRCGVAARGTEMVAVLRRRLATIGAEVAGAPRPRVAVVEWVDPPFTAGHWVPDLVAAAGGEPVAADPHSPTARTSRAEIRSAAPDVVVVSPCGFHLDGAARQAAQIVHHVPGVPVWAIDADGIVVRPGPRLVDGVEALAAVLHPDLVAAQPDRVIRVS